MPRSTHMLALAVLTAVPALSGSGPSVSAPEGMRKYRSKQANVKSNAPAAAAQALGRRVDHYCELFDAFYSKFDLSRKNDNEIKIRLFASHEEFEEFYQRTTSNPGATPLAYFSPSLNSVVMYDDEEDVALRAVVFHECSHQFLNRYTYDAPSWLNEGLAEYFEGWKVVEGVSGTTRPHLFDMLLVRAAIAADQYLTPEELVTMPSADFRAFRSHRGDKHPYLHYATAWSVVYYLLESGHEDDRAILVRYLRDLNAKGSSARFEVEDWDRLTERWKAFLARLDAQPTDAIDHFLIASSQREGQQWKEAIAGFEAALQADPKLPAAAYWLGYCLKRAGSYARAITVLEEVARSDPADPRPQYWLARLHLGLDRAADRVKHATDPERALAHARAASAIHDGKNPLYAWLEAECLLALGRGKEATALARKLPKLAEDDDRERWEELSDEIRERAKGLR